MLGGMFEWSDRIFIKETGTKMKEAVDDIYPQMYGIK